MKKITFFILSGTLLCIANSLYAQSWNIGGNPNTDVPAGGGQLGTNGNRLVIFETNNIERGRLMNTSGFWGFNTIAPNARVHINSAAGEDAFRVQVNGSTKLFVDDAGGVSVGSVSVAPANGLFVSGNAGFGTTLPDAEVHVLRGSAGAITANANAPLVVENSTSNYINLLTPSANERGILFGDNLNASDGGIIYVGSSNSMQFRTNGNITRMTLSDAGNLDIAGGSLSFGSVETLSDAGANTIGSNSSVVPTTDNLWDLGSSALRWDEVWATDGTINTSDARDKKNIEDLKYGLKEIMQLRPVKFQWINARSNGDKLGVIAQEIQKVLPQVVKDHEYRVNEETGAMEKVPAARLGVMYADIIPVLIRGIQEQQKTITTLEDRIAKLESALNASASAKFPSGIDASSVTLEQNQPNPFNQTTLIRYKIPAGANAQINIYDASGAMVKTMRAPENGQAQINAGELKAGAYTYALVVDGKLLASKKMVMLK